jgi:NodT family efflux transporter outer membrane factor (OMF) lipoprotein
MTLNLSKYRRASLLCSAAALLSACATPPDLGARPQMAAPEQYESTRSFAAPEADWPSDRWWESYGDEQLSSLIDEALRDSPTLAIAAARVRQAQGAAQQTGSSLYPTIGAQGSVQQSRRELSGDLPGAIQNALPNDWSTQANASLQISYQLDFFGRNRASFAAATSTTHAAEAEAASARLQLSTAVALAYAQLLQQCADRNALEDAAHMRQVSVELVRQKVEAGLENQGQLDQANAEFAQVHSDLIASRGAILRTRNELAALLGKGPDRGLDIAEPTNPSISTIGLPARVDLDLIGRRPDLVAARLNAEAAAHNIDVARADYYPNINLAAMIGLQTLGLGSLGDSALSFGQVGPAISLPIFSGGRLDGQYRGARGRYDEAVAQYDQTLTNALHEVADAIVDRRTVQAQLIEQHRALDAAESAYRVAQIRYRGGLASYIDTLSVESSLIQQRRSVAALEAQAFALDIALVRALGGGFTTT